MTDICAIIEEQTGQAVTLDTEIESLKVDSLEFVDLLMVLGDAAGKDIPAKRMALLKTVSDIQEALS